MSNTDNLVPQLADAILRGFAMGLSVKAGMKATSDNHDTLAENPVFSDNRLRARTLFSGNHKPEAIIAEVDAFVNSSPALNPLREYLFDLAMLKIIREGMDEEGEDYLDSAEMMALEDKNIDRGTELLNLLIYIKDCKIYELEPEIGDFLNEFLLVEEDDFQDEFFIYEEVIKNQQLVDGTVQQIVETGRTIQSDEVKEIFVPMMTFFHQRALPGGETLTELLNTSSDPALDVALFSLLVEFDLKEEGEKP